MRTRTKVQKPQSYGICPLCEKAFLRAQLQVHRKAEQSKARREIIKAIKAEYPLWVQEDGACRHCWDSFRGVVRVANFMKAFKLPKRRRRPLACAGKRAQDRTFI
jgi:hypothetical protein